MRRLAAVAMIVAVLLDVSVAIADEPAEGKTGTYTATFTQRSPLSNPRELAIRLGQKKLEPDYDLTKTEFIVHVPPNYDPAKPIGLIVLLNYKQVGDAPTPVLPVHRFLRSGVC